ncbi:MAG: tRNA (adenosine(37)-N6)-threonylcarbamoyltransferase complex ATPase subunit type 1 TsaE [Pseudomonadota bacterium]
MSNESAPLFTVELEDEAATLRCAAGLAVALIPGLIISLKGQLGAGKTTFVRGALRALGHEGAVKSPTYTIVEPYIIAGIEINHFDLYRLGDVEELELLGFRDYLNESSVCFVEWPQRAQGYLPPSDLEIDLCPKSGSNSGARIMQTHAQTDIGLRVIEKWNQEC